MSYSQSPVAWGSGAVVTPGTSQSDSKHSHKHSSHRKHKHSKHSDGKRSSHHKHKHKSSSQGDRKHRHNDSQPRPVATDGEDGEVEDGELMDLDDFKVQDEWIDVEEGEICDSPDEAKDKGELHGDVKVGHAGAVSQEGIEGQRQYEQKKHRRKHKDKHDRRKDKDKHDRRKDIEAYSRSQVQDERVTYGGAYSGSSYEVGVDSRMDYDAYNDSKGRGRSDRISHSGAILRDDRNEGAILIEDRDDSDHRISSQRGSSPYGMPGYSDMAYKSSGQREMSSRRAHSVRRGSSPESLGRPSGALLLDDRDEHHGYYDRFMARKKHKEGLHDKSERSRKIRPSQREDRPLLKEDGAVVTMDRPLLRENGTVVREKVFGARDDRTVSENRIRKDRPLLKEDGAVVRTDRTVLRDDRAELAVDTGRKDRPILKEDGAVVSESRPLLRENGTIVRKGKKSRENRPILKEDGALVRNNDRAVLKEDGAVVREDRMKREEWPKVDGDTDRKDRPILKENGTIVRESRPVLKEDGAIIRTDRLLEEDMADRRDRPVLKEDGEFVRDNRSTCRDVRPVLKEDGEVVRMDRPILKEDGAIVRESRPFREDRSSLKDEIVVKQERPILKEDGAIVREDKPLRDDCQGAKGVKKDRPILKEDGVIIREAISVKEEGPVLKENGEIVSNDRPVLREDGAIVREDKTMRDTRPVLKENREIVRNDRPVLKEDGEIVRNDRPVLKEDGEIVRIDRPVLKEDGEIVRIDRPVLKEDGEIVRTDRPILREDGEIVSNNTGTKTDRPVLREDGAIVKEERPLRDEGPILKEDGEIIRNDRPVLKEDGAIVSENSLNKEVRKKRSVVRGDSAIIPEERPVKGDWSGSKEINNDRPVLREDGEIVEDNIIHRDDWLKNDGLILREDGEIVEDNIVHEDDRLESDRAILREDGEIVEDIHWDDQPVLKEDGAFVRDDRHSVRESRSVCRDDKFGVSRDRSVVREEKPAIWNDSHAMEDGEVSDSAANSRNSRKRGSVFNRIQRKKAGRKQREASKKRGVSNEVDMEWDATFYREENYNRPSLKRNRNPASNVVRIGDLIEETDEFIELDSYTEVTDQWPDPTRGHLHGDEDPHHKKRVRKEKKRKSSEKRKKDGSGTGRGHKVKGHSQMGDAKKKSGTSRDIAVQRLKKRSENIWNSKYSRDAKSLRNAESMRGAHSSWNDNSMGGAMFPRDIFSLRRGLRRHEASPWGRDDEPPYKRRRRREPSPAKEKPCIRSGSLPQLDEADEEELTEYTAPIAAWVRSSAADLYFIRDMKNPRNTVTTKRQQELEKKFEHDLVERAERIITSLPPVTKQTDRPEWLKRRHCNHSHNQAKESKDSDDCSSSDSDSEDESEQWWLDEMKRKQEHPRRLHPELWYNDPGELNYEPLCRCSLKARKTGIRHNKYPGEEPLPKCDVNSNNLDKLFHYKITVSPVTNFLTKHPSVITFDGREYMFEGFSIFTHEVIPPMPPCQVIRFNIVYTIHVVEEQAPENFSVRSLDLITKFLFDEILELVDIDWKGPGGDDNCNIFHIMPRFARPFPENGKEIMSINDVLLYLLKSSKPLVDRTDLDRLRRLDKEDWQKYMDDFQYMVVTNPSKKPRSIRIDQLDRAGTENKGSQFPVIVHKGLRPALLSYAGDPAYRKKWREYLKFRQLLWTRVKLSEEDKMKLEDMQMELQRIRIKCTMKKDVLVAVDSSGFLLTGIRSDMCQHAMLLPVLFGHVRFHSCLRSFQKIIKYQFKDITLLQLAFTHSSYKVNYGTNPDHGRNSLSNCGSRQLEFGDIFVHTTNRRKKGLCVLLHIMSKMAKKKEVKSDIPHNERLEFLGDAVLEFITSTRLFAMFPNCDEGDLSTFRGALVQNAHLSVLADKLQLQDYLLYAHGPDLCHTADLRHAMANCFEAIMGAMYLDGGIELADRVFAETLFDDSELLDIWMNVPKHPLQHEEPNGDRHWINNSPSLKKLQKFESDIGYEFEHIRLLARAFTQRIIGYNHLTKGHNQTLEFLGDTIMQLISSDFLYRHFPDHHEGHLTLLRSSLVSNRTQATVADELGMMNYVITQRVMNKMPKIKEKADIFEAVLAALYVDGGLEPCKILLNVCFYPRLEMFIVNLAWNDPKSQLQQFCLTLRDIKDETPDIPEYKVVDAKGPTHKRVYRVAVYFRGNRLAVGTGRSKQQGEMNAAMQALSKSKDLFPNQVSIEDKMTKIVAPPKDGKQW